ncbi:MAG TPA: hypothetical protein VGR35_07560 [Tepidisphaeraceae bacterium]|nr:hypothetical protein [Tepidisphaeraceae bacterium]
MSRTIVRRTFLPVALLMLAAAVPIVAETSVKPVDVVAVARSFPDGGGYNIKWGGSGTVEEIRFNNTRILAKGENGTYCCGFTFNVVMKAAGQAGLLKDKTVEQIKRFQKEWYGAVTEPDIREKQCAVALGNLGIGKQVSADEAQAGDFLQFWRTKSGHSVVFLNWVEKDGQRIGFTYRSSQGSTDGIGDKTEYFKDSGVAKGEVDPKRMYFGRLGAGPAT